MSKIDISKMTREEWLEIRRGGIGGSDAAGIVGMNRFSTPTAVWMDKVGLTPLEKEETEAMRLGHDLEDYVAQRFCEETGKKVKRSNKMYWNGIMLADVDRLIVGEKAGLECKTTSELNLRNFKNGEYPDNYYIQCLHYLAVTGLEKWYLAVLIFSKGFKIFEIERDEEEIQELIRLEKEFWEEYVLPKKEPPVDGLRPTSEAIKTAYHEGNGKQINLVGRDRMIDDWFRNLEKIKILETENERIKQTLQTDLKDFEEGYSNAYKVTWKTQQRAILSQDMIKAAYPGIDLNRFKKVNSSRVFKINKIKRSN